MSAEPKVIGVRVVEDCGDPSPPTTIRVRVVENGEPHPSPPTTIRVVRVVAEDDTK